MEENRINEIGKMTLPDKLNDIFSTKFGVLDNIAADLNNIVSLIKNIDNTISIVPIETGIQNIETEHKDYTGLLESILNKIAEIKSVSATTIASSFSKPNLFICNISLAIFSFA